MSLTYVIPDIHGRSDLLRDGLARIAAHARGGYGTLVALGDYVNKGPDSKAVIELLRAGPLPGWPFIPLKGNHDAMMVDGLCDHSKMQWWLDRGGDTTIASYGGDPSKVPPDDIEWLDGLALIRRLLPPTYRFSRVRRNAHPIGVKITKKQLGTRIALFRGFPLPFHCFLQIDREA